jgi:hypothetical protein
MKQLVLVLLIAATTLSVSAQRDYHNNNRDYDKHDRVDRYDNNRYDKFNGRQKEEFRRQLERINQHYNAKINSVSRNHWISRRKREMKINQLENERRIALNECRAKFYRKMDYAERGRNNKRNKW